MPLRDFLSITWNHIQANLFPWLTEELGPLTDTHKQVIATLELVRIETLMRDWPGLPGRPLRDRAALARAFVAKAVMGLPTTSMLIERLAVDKRLRRLCGNAPDRCRASPRSRGLLPSLRHASCRAVCTKR